jgi:CheY-like chemotaxis protein
MRKKILLADDSVTIQKVIELTFSDRDIEVVSVGNGRLAIEGVQKLRPDLVICDVVLPEKDGYEVCSFIKRSAELSGIPVLLLSGAFESFDQGKAERAGADGFLSKPFEPQALIAKVEALFGAR